MGIGMGLILLVLPLLILSVILSLLLFLYISYEEKSFKNTWGQLLIMSLWLGMKHYFTLKPSGKTGKIFYNPTIES